jgi:hypothetical protein
MPFNPHPYTHYHIQNADFETYLEVRDVETGSNVIMRPLKENPKQMVIGYIYWYQAFLDSWTFFTVVIHRYR